MHTNQKQQNRGQQYRCLQSSPVVIRITTTIATWEIFQGKKQIYNDKTSMLRYKIDENTSFSMSQQLLLRDVIFTFQGIDGKYIRFSKSENSYAIDPKIGIPTPVRVLLLKLSRIWDIYFVK